MFDAIVNGPCAPQTRAVLEEIMKWDEDQGPERIRRLLRDRQFGSLVDPQREARVWADGFYDEKYDVFILLGTGRMHYHRALLEKMNERQKIFILDWHLPLIWKGMKEIEGELKFLNAVWYFHHTPGEITYRIGSILDDFMTLKIRFGVIPPYIYHFKDQVDKIEKDISHIISLNMVRSLTMEFFGAKWAENMLENFPCMVKGVPFKHLQGAFRGRPAIVVSAGPSLEKNIGLLPDLKNKAVIIGAGSAIDTLKQHGITPHLLASFDGGEGNYRHFEKLESKDIRLVFTGDIYPRIVREFKGRLIPVEASNKRTYDYLKQFGAPDLGEAMIGPSVANMALDVAVNLGCNPIILIGQDLSFAGGKSHASGNAFLSDESEAPSTSLIKVKGNLEETVTTTKSWFSMLKFFEAQARGYKDRRIVNATEGGAYIEGTEVRTLLEAQELYLQEEFDPEARLDKTLSVPADTPSVNSEDILGRVRKDIDLHLDEVSAAIPLLKKLTERLDKKYRVGSAEKELIDRLKKREVKLIQSKIYDCLIRNMIHGRILYYERYYKRLAADDPERVEVWVARYQQELFTNSLKALRELSSFLDDTIEERT